jgi:hypothetical protein
MALSFPTRHRPLASPSSVRNLDFLASIPVLIATFAV